MTSLEDFLTQNGFITQLQPHNFKMGFLVYHLTWVVCVMPEDRGNTI